jgi:hypothetical protein
LLDGLFETAIFFKILPLLLLMIGVHYLLLPRKTVDESDGYHPCDAVMARHVDLPTRRRADKPPLHRSADPVQLVSTATSSKQRLLTEVEVLGGASSPYLTSKLRLLERGAFLNLVIYAVKNEYYSFFR